MIYVAQIAMIYAVGAVLVGAATASASNVKASWNGTAVKHPRVVAGIGAGVLWPVVIWQMIFPSKNAE